MPARLAARAPARLLLTAPPHRAPARAAPRQPPRVTRLHSAAVSDAEAHSDFVLELDTEGDFDALLRDTPGKLVVLACCATWCGPCKLFKPTFNTFAEAYAAQAQFVEVLGDANKSTAALMKRLGVKAVPAFFIFREGKVVSSFTGANKIAFRRELGAHLKLYD